MTEYFAVRSSWLRTAGIVLIAAVALAACRPEEQDRLVRYEPGVYKGKPDAQLSDESLKTLRSRARLQGGSTGSGIYGGSASPPRGGDVRAPKSSTSMKDRIKLQSGAK